MVVPDTSVRRATVSLVAECGARVPLLVTSGSGSQAPSVPAGESPRHHSVDQWEKVETIDSDSGMPKPIRLLVVIERGASLGCTIKPRGRTWSADVPTRTARGWPGSRLEIEPGAAPVRRAADGLGGVPGCLLRRPLSSSTAQASSTISE